MLLFVAVLARGFSFVGKYVMGTNSEPSFRFLAWALGASLFAHAATFISVSYFDQSVVFLYLALAAIGSVRLGVDSEKTAEKPVWTGAPRSPAPLGRSWAGAYARGSPSSTWPHSLRAEPGPRASSTTTDAAGPPHLRAGVTAVEVEKNQRAILPRNPHISGRGRRLRGERA